MADKKIPPVVEDLETIEGGELPEKKENGMDVEKVIEAAEKVGKDLEKAESKKGGESPTA